MFPAGHPAADVVDEAALRRRVEALLSERAALYEETADVVIDIDGLSTPAIAARLLALPSTPPTPPAPPTSTPDTPSPSPSRP